MFNSNCRVGKDWAGPFFPPSLIFRSSIDRFVFRILLLFHSILTFMKDLYQCENQVFNPTRLLVLLHCWVGKEWAGPFFPPSKMLGSFYLSSRLLDYDILLLYLNSLDLYQVENQVFMPTRLFVIVGWGKTGPAHSFPPLNLSIFYWSFRLSVYIILSLYFNIYERPIPKWESSFQSNKIIGTSTLLGGERLGRPILSPPPIHNAWIFQIIV